MNIIFTKKKINFSVPSSSKIETLIANKKMKNDLVNDETTWKIQSLSAGTVDIPI